MAIGNTGNDMGNTRHVRILGATGHKHDMLEFWELWGPRGMLEYLELLITRHVKYLELWGTNNISKFCETCRNVRIYRNTQHAVKLEIIGNTRHVSVQ